ncbi:MAG: hypothetical protein D3910_10145 [Candidatus Electrothrix sp. ATG2]|nr:hypothetical protein [Candidatus Electrothrix sp. ATG2]
MQVENYDFEFYKPGPRYHVSLVSPKKEIKKSSVQVSPQLRIDHLFPFLMLSRFLHLRSFRWSRREYETTYQVQLMRDETSGQKSSLLKSHIF